MNTARNTRKSKQQDWEIGNTVKVGFQTMTIVAKNGREYACQNVKGSWFRVISHVRVDACSSLAECLV
jgi:hypothetical protein